MKHHFIDDFAYKKGFLQRVDTGLKVILLILLLLCVLVIPEKVLFYIPFIILTFLFLIFSKIPFIYFLKRILIIFPFLLVLFSLSIFKENGLRIFLFSFLKSLISISFVFLFVMTTKMTALSEFIKKLPAGFLISDIFSFLYRYFFLLQDEFEKMKRAMISKGKNPKLKDYALLSGNLFIRSYERSERVLKAMISRGWKIK